MELWPLMTGSALASLVVLDRQTRYFVCHKFLLPCSVRKDRNGTENEVMSILAPYLEEIRQALLV